MVQDKGEYKRKGKSEKKKTNKKNRKYKKLMPPLPL
jgi:hypothetical protein